MSHTDDCPCGRSQLLTFKAKETITVDRVTLEQLLALLNSCAKELAFATINSIFPESLKTYLSGLNGPKADKALVLLSPWTDTVPEALEEITENLDEAKHTIEFILAVTTGVSNG
jgi:hypothetical protein